MLFEPNLPGTVQSVDSDPSGGRPLLRQNFMPSDDAAYREASFARSQDSMTQAPIYSRLAAQSTTGRHVQMSAPSKSRLAPESSPGSFASVARSEASFMSSIGGSRIKEQALADTYARACARLRALEVCLLLARGFGLVCLGFLVRRLVSTSRKQMAKHTLRPSSVPSLCEVPFA